ncbi:MAG: GGDEF domain-containing protein [Spirochaetota bacterium]
MSDNYTSDNHAQQNDDRNDEKRDLLTHVEMFSTLNTSELESIAAYSEVVSLSAGEQLFAEGQPGDALYVVKTGSIVISQSQEEGKQVDIAEYIAEECFGEIDVLHSAPRSAAARAEVDAELLRFPRKGCTLEEIFEQDPAVSARLLQKLIVAIADRIRDTNRLISENSPWVQQLRSQVFGDKLTGLYNRAYLEEELPQLLNSENSPFGLLMVKPDDFKLINDKYGHDAGDLTLRQIAATVRAWAQDRIAVRFRGNEMAVLLFRSDREQAVRLAEELRRTLCEMDLESILGDNNVEFNFSAGLAMYPEDVSNADDLIARSHATLFAARESGANQTLSADQVTV